MSDQTTKEKPFDFDDLNIGEAAEKPFEFELLHPESKAGLGVFISVIGAESDTFQTYLREEGNRARRKALEAERRGKQPEPSTIEEDEEKILRAIAVCIKSWRTVIDGKSEPVIVWSGRKIECTRDNALQWMRKFRWVRQQINDATGDLGNFIAR